MTDTTIDPVQVALLCLAISIPVSLWLYYSSNTHNNKNNRNVPNATGSVPLLGHALQYKDDPTGCIRRQEISTGSKIFRVNLAGRRMVIVGSDPDALQQLASQPERTLSSRRAVAELGFEHVLGSLNVYEGTDWHKSILKNHIAGSLFRETFLPNIFQALRVSIDDELLLQQAPTTTTDSSTTNNSSNNNDPNFVQIPDLFAFVRRCVLRATLDEFVSPLLLQKDPRLLADLMAFQDQLEDAIAKSAVLPRFLALPAFLWPVQRIREGLQRRISALLPGIYEQQGSTNNHSTVLGPWLKTYLAEKTSPEVAAEHLIGLIFAAHKNPSIGASQCLCFLRKELNDDQQRQAADEARRICENRNIHKTSLLLEGLLNAKILRACVLESNRLVAHTLGAVRYANKPLEVTTTTKETQQTPPEGSHDKTKKRQIKINAGETVSFAHHTMHMEPSLWGSNAAEFQLDRPEWKQQDNNSDDLGVPVDQYKYTTFSNGVHKCPGERVAMAMMEIILALLVHKEAHFVGDMAPLCFERATLAQRDGPCCVRLKRT